LKLIHLCFIASDIFNNIMFIFIYRRLYTIKQT